MEALLGTFVALDEKAVVFWRKRGGEASLTRTATTTQAEAITLILDFVENAEGGRYREEFLERLARHDR